MSLWTRLAAPLVALVALAAAPAGAQAQTQTSALISTPAEKFAVAPGGVDMRTGRYVYSRTDLSIGGEGESAGLALTRTLTAPVAGHANPFGNLSHNWDIMVSERRVQYDNPDNAGTDFRVFVHFGGRSMTYQSRFDSAEFAQLSDTASAPLTFAGDRTSASVVYTYTAADGTVATFRPLGTLGSGDCSTVRRCAYVESIVEADGTRFTFDYVPAGTGVRLARVTSSRGYALLLEGSGALVTRACVLNLAAGPAPASAQCPAGAPSAAYSYTTLGATTVLASATGPDNAAESFAYSEAAPPPTSFKSSAFAMRFTKPGQSAPWLTNTYFQWDDEEGIAQDVVARQAFAGGERFDYAFNLSPAVGYKLQTLAGGAWTNALGEGSSIAYDWPAAPGQTYPGGPCRRLPCAQPMPDDSYTYVYQQTPGPVSVSDGMGRTTGIAYCDSAGLASSEWRELHRCIVLSSAQSFTGPDGALTELRYDGNRNIVEVRRHPRPGALNPDGTVPADIVTSAVYDTQLKSRSKPVSMTDGRGNTTHWTYDPVHGGMLTETGPAPSPGAPRPQTRYEYTRLTPRFADGTAGPPVWLLAKTSACKAGAPAAGGVGCANGASDEVVTTFDYGPASGPNNLLLRSKTVDAGGLDLRTCYYYDGIGNKVAETSPRGAALGCPALPSSGPPPPFTTASRFDVERRLTGTIAPDPDGSGPLRHAAVRNTYDSAGRLVKVEKGELASWQPESTAPANWSGFTVFETVETGFDALDRKVSELVSGTAGAESFTQTRYDLAGRVLCVAVRMNKAAFGQQGDACALGPQGSQGPDRITKTDYNAAGDVVAVWKAWGVTTQNGFPATLQQRYVAYEYGPTGRQTAVVDANGNRAEMRYDGFDRQDRWVFPSAGAAGAVNEADYEAYGYDPNGNRTRLRKRDGAVLAFDYDALNRVTVKTVPASASGAAGYAVSTGYDNRGLQTWARFGSPSGPGVTNAWDSAGRQVSASTDMGGSTWSLSYAWDEDGNRVAVGGMVYAYDGLGRLTGIFNGGPAGPLAAFGYGPDGSVAAVANLWSTMETASTRFERDPAGRLGRLTQLLGGGLSNETTFDYNNASQIVARTSRNDAYAWSPPNPVDRGYSANGLNQYSLATDRDPQGNPVQRPFAYDLNGNLASDGATTFVYDSENRLVSARGARNADLAYDPLGRLWRVSDPVAGTATRFDYDGDRLVLERDGAGNLRHYYVHGNAPDQPLVWWDFTAGGARRFLHADHQGSIVAVSNGQTGAPIAVNRYDPWGVPGAGNTGRFQYTGQAWIPELGMYYYKARIYWPMLGRFLQVDPVGYEDQVNLYAYVGNDPFNKTDPTGMVAGVDDAALFGILAVAVGTAYVCQVSGACPRFSAAVQQAVEHVTQRVHDRVFGGRETGGRVKGPSKAAVTSEARRLGRGPYRCSNPTCDTQHGGSTGTTECPDCAGKRARGHPLPGPKPRELPAKPLRGSRQSPKEDRDGD